MTGVLPAIPSSVDDYSRIKKWILGGNNKYGTCGPTSLANDLLILTTYLNGVGISATDEQVFDLYRLSGNPNFDPDTDADDNGVDLQTMLEAAVKAGIAGHDVLGFGSFDHTNLDELRAAVAVFGCILIGVNLEVAQQTQTVWDYDPKNKEAWGGHAIAVGRFVKDPTLATKDRTACITWASIMDMTDLFLAHQLDEAWAVILPEHLHDKTFLEGVDQAALRSAYTSLTNRPFPSSPVPVPPPAPGPTPTPSPVVYPEDVSLADSVRSWVAKRHTGTTKPIAAALKTWMGKKGL
jgi:hypothetical protein